MSNGKFKKVQLGTEIMKIPVEWEVKDLFTTAEILSSNVDKKIFNNENSVFLCNYLDVYKNDYINQSMNFMEATASDMEIEKFSLQSDDVIITKDSETPDDIAIPALVTEKMINVICGYHLSIIRTYKNILSGSFLAKLFQITLYRDYFHTVANGVTRFGLTLDSIKKMQVLLPPLPEQKKIAEILSSVDEAIQATQKVIEQTKLVKKGLVQELLTKGIGHTKFKKMKLGTEEVEIPVEWELNIFGNICKSNLYGPRFSAKEYTAKGNVKTIRGTDINEYGNIMYEQAPEALLDENLVKLHRLLHGDIIIITTADCGVTGVFEECSIPFIPSAYTVRYRLKENISSYFIKFYMQTFYAKNQVNGLIRKGTVANLAGSDVLKIRLPVPPIPEQKQIAEILSSVDESIQQKQTKLEQLKQVKKGLMQDLLTGKVRVKV